MLSKLQASELDDHQPWRRTLLSIEDKHVGINVLTRVLMKEVWKRPAASSSVP